MNVTMVGRLGECVLLAYRTPMESVRHLVPPALELVTRDGDAFWNVVACRIDAMRPRGVPQMLGLSYHHVAYRLYVRARTADGKAIDGLYFVRSDADRTPLVWAGNVFSEFRFNRAAIKIACDDTRVDVRVRPKDGADGALSVRSSARAPAMPHFLRYRPVALSCDSSQRWLKLAEVVRDESAWREFPVEVLEAKWTYLVDQLAQEDLRLVAATRVAPIDYVWKLGRRVPLAAPPVAPAAAQSTSAGASASFPACSTTSGRG